MFRCDNCGKQTESGEKVNYVNITRHKEYEQYKLEFDPKTRRNKKEYYTTEGYEIARELRYCNDCFTKGEIVDGD